MSEDDVVRGFFDIAVENMARAVRRVSVAKGHDPQRDVLVTFGGAGGQYACAVAERLRCTRVIVHPYAGLLSAYGIGRADERRDAEAAVLKPLSEWDAATLDALAAEATAQLTHFDAVTDELDLRYIGTEATLRVPVTRSMSHDEIADAFHNAHNARYGYQRDRAVEVVMARVVATHAGDRTDELFDDQRWPAHPTDVTTEPAILADPFSTTVIDPGWRGERRPNGSLVLTHERPVSNPTTPTTQKQTQHAVRLELFHSRFAAIAEQMGVVLQNTSVSTNVKERLDFSCALFDADGNLVVNAPHIPVHLGAMGETVRHLIATQSITVGDVFVTNDPYRGGSHLPDVTVVTPVFVADSGDRPAFFVASRAHHAEIGGIVPGSIPPHSKTLADEGVLIRDFRLIGAGEDNTEALRNLLASGPHPSRNVADNLADIAAQAAANQAGATLLLDLVDRETLDVVQEYTGHIREAAAEKTKAALRQWSRTDSVFNATDTLDDGSPIVVTITINNDRATFDFTGTGPVLESNLNANRGIVTAAVLYVLRLLIGRVDASAASMPLNDGVLQPIDIILPECLLNPPANDDPSLCPAMVGGNTETSQRVVDVLIAALKLAAASQGTMNNVTFGDEAFGYYETIAGGAGATELADGADAVQVHMTNTRMTDVEVVEHRYPVRVRQFGIRSNSGGFGKHRGGNGVVRELEFLKPLSLSIVTGRRMTAPPGASGGSDGTSGKNTLLRADGETVQLKWRDHQTVNAGDVLRLETPGGGGFGA